MEVNTSDYSNNFNLVLHVAMVIFVKKDNKTNLWYVQNAIVIAGYAVHYHIQPFQIKILRCSNDGDFANTLFSIFGNDGPLNTLTLSGNSTNGIIQKET